MKILILVVLLSELSVGNAVSKSGNTLSMDELISPAHYSIGGPFADDKLRTDDFKFTSCIKYRDNDHRFAVTEQSYLWPDNKVYYVLSYNFTKYQKKVIYKAMENIQSKTCIEFIKREREPNFINITAGNSGCWSYLGMVGGMQEVNLQGDNCLNETGIAVHEFLHALGVFHEHQRSDRDDYVTIHYENMVTEAASSYVKYNTTELTTFGLEYDMLSVMHYRRYQGTSNGRPVISAKDEFGSPTFGNFIGMTLLDKAKLNYLYSCKM